MILTPIAPEAPVANDFDPGFDHPKQDIYLIEPPIPCPEPHNPPSMPPSLPDRHPTHFNPWKTPAIRRLLSQSVR